MIGGRAGPEVQFRQLLRSHRTGEIPDDVRRRPANRRRELAYLRATRYQSLDVGITCGPGTAGSILRPDEIKGARRPRSVGLNAAVYHRPGKILVLARQQHGGQPARRVGGQPTWGVE